MFLRCNRRTYQGEAYEYWPLIRTVRTAKGPRHQIVAHLGKSPGLDADKRLADSELIAEINALFREP